MKPIIRRAVKSDIEAIYALSCKVHNASYAVLIPDDHRDEFLADFTFSDQKLRDRYDYFLPRLVDPSWYVWVAELDGHVVGYTKEVRTDSHTISKRGLFVDPDYQGRGIGTALFETSLSIARSGGIFHLEVIEGNKKAQDLYKKHGFKITGYAPADFYGAKMVMMELTIS